MTSPYEILGITPDADHETIKKAFRDLSKLHHPDVGGDENKFIEIKNAYECLTDPQKKRMYDDLGVMPGTPEFDLIGEALNYISFVFAKMITETDLDTFKRRPLISLLVSISQREQLDHEMKLKTYRQAQDRCQTALEIMTKQCKKKRENSPNVFIKVLHMKIAEVEQAMIPEKRAIEVMKKAQELLQEYEFSPEQTPMLGSIYNQNNAMWSQMQNNPLV